MIEMAKAARKLANNAEVETVNDANRIRVMEKLIQVLENILPTYITEEVRNVIVCVCYKYKNKIKV